MYKIKKNLAGIDNVLFEKSRRAKRINISIKPFRGIRVAVPYGVSFQYAESIFLNKIEWVEEKLQIIRDIEDNRPVYGLSGPIQTNSHILHIINNGTEKPKIKQSGKKIDLYIPASIEIINKEIQKTIRALLIEIYRQEAKDYLPSRVDKLARENNFQFNKVYIKCQKTLWGSCSGRKNINLNLNLMRLSEVLRDYVIFHELLHTKIRNHGHRFWNILSNYIEEPRKMDKKLKSYNLRYYIP